MDDQSTGHCGTRMVHAESGLCHKFHQVIIDSSEQAQSRVEPPKGPPQGLKRSIDEITLLKSLEGDNIIEISYKVREHGMSKVMDKRDHEYNSAEKDSERKLPKKRNAVNVKDGYIKKENNRKTSVLKAKSYIVKERKCSRTECNETSPEDGLVQRIVMKKEADGDRERQVGDRVKVKKLHMRVKRITKTHRKEQARVRVSPSVDNIKKNQTVERYPFWHRPEGSSILKSLRCSVLLLIMFQLLLIMSSLVKTDITKWVFFCDGTQLSEASFLQRRRKELRHIPALFRMDIGVPPLRWILALLSGITGVAGTLTTSAYAIVPTIVITTALNSHDWVDSMMVVYNMYTTVSLSTLLCYFIATCAVTGLQLYLCWHAYQLFILCLKCKYNTRKIKGQ